MCINEYKAWQRGRGGSKMSKKKKCYIIFEWHLCVVNCLYKDKENLIESQMFKNH